MKRFCKARLTIILVVVFLISGGCALRSSTKTKFYMLNPLIHPAVWKQNNNVKKCKTIGLGPIGLPAYLDRPQIVTRINANEFKLAEIHNWAEPLKDNISRVLVENISRLICVKDVAIYPWRESLNINYQIDIKIIQMDGKLGDKAILVVRWALIDGADKSILWTKRSKYTESVTNVTYSALVVAQSRLIAAFSQDIAGAVKSLS